jgi:hypothetical protein
MATASTASAADAGALSVGVTTLAESLRVQQESAHLSVTASPSVVSSVQIQNVYVAEVAGSVTTYRALGEVLTHAAAGSVIDSTAEGEVRDYSLKGNTT